MKSKKTGKLEVSFKSKFKDMIQPCKSAIRKAILSGSSPKVAVTRVFKSYKIRDKFKSILVDHLVKAYKSL